MAAIFVLQCANAPEYITLSEKLTLPSPPVVVFGLESLTNVSNNDYNENTFGLITASTLEAWRSNWYANRPGGISGNLVVFQVTSGALSGAFLRPTTGVKVYGLPTSSSDYTFFGQTRFNGVIETETIVPEGANIDAFLKFFGVDPAVDLIVFAQDSPSDSNLMSTLRSWYTLYYWGVEKSHLAVLNGSISSKISASILTGGSIYTTPASAGAGKIGNLLRDQTIVQATLADVFNVVKNITVSTYENSTPAPSEGSFLLDARSVAEYNGNAGATVGPSNFSCTGSPCYATYEGHINGAINIPYANFIDANKEFLSKADLVNLLQTNGYQQGQTIITYCRTNVRSSITGFATLAILGYPTRFYDGSWVEWGSLAYDSTGAWSNLSGNSPWRTDISTVTSPSPILYNVGRSGITSANVSSLSSYFSPAMIYAKGANAIIDADKKFLAGSASSGGGGGSSGGGGGGGGNPCGG
ncbi:rhodanese-like protein [Leptospira wolffii serovar Khorat str. Khorat-H2]|nr:rhodanese-like protein [Leptospira wolffii serovar Khorat str. Khorat-H2]